MRQELVIIAAILVATPVVLFPVALVWFIIRQMRAEAPEERETKSTEAKVVVE